MGVGACVAKRCMIIIRPKLRQNSEICNGKCLHCGGCGVFLYLLVMLQLAVIRGWKYQ